MRFWDTSPWYGRGQSEHRVGRFLYDLDDRADFVLNTKVGRRLVRPRSINATLDHPGPATAFPPLGSWEQPDSAWTPTPPPSRARDRSVEQPKCWPQHKHAPPRHASSIVVPPSCPLPYRRPSRQRRSIRTHCVGDALLPPSPDHTTDQTCRQVSHGRSSLITSTTTPTTVSCGRTRTACSGWA